MDENEKAARLAKHLAREAARKARILAARDARKATLTDRDRADIPRPFTI